MLKKMWPLPVFIAIALYTVSVDHTPTVNLILFAIGIVLAVLAFWTMRPR